MTITRTSIPFALALLLLGAAFVLAPATNYLAAQSDDAAGDEAEVVTFGDVTWEVGDGRGIVSETEANQNLEISVQGRVVQTIAQVVTANEDSAVRITGINDDGMVTEMEITINAVNITMTQNGQTAMDQDVEFDSVITVTFDEDGEIDSITNEDGDEIDDEVKVGAIGGAVQAFNKERGILSQIAGQTLAAGEELEIDDTDPWVGALEEQSPELQDLTVTFLGTEEVDGVLCGMFSVESTVDIRPQPTMNLTVTQKIDQILYVAIDEPRLVSAEGSTKMTFDGDVQGATIGGDGEGTYTATWSELESDDEEDGE